MEDLWRRDIAQWRNANETPWHSDLGLPFTRGTDARVLTQAADREESCTLMLRLPAGWAYRAERESGTLELLVLAGGVIVDGQSVSVGGFVALPTGVVGAELSSSTGAYVIAFWNQFAPGSCYDGQPYLYDTKAHAWTAVEAPGMPHGTFFKPLRIPFMSDTGFGGPAGSLSLIASLPTFATATPEHHGDVWEELLCLSGDTMFPDRGTGGAGTIINNPPWFEHGPFCTCRGHIALMHCLSPLQILPAAENGGIRKIQDYLETQPICENFWTDKWPEDEQKRKTALQSLKA